MLKKNTKIYVVKSIDYNDKTDFIKFILKKYYNINDYNIFYNKYGKPYIDCNLYINWSDSKDYLALAISYDEIGIDIEKIRPFPTILIKELINDKEKYLNNNYLEVWVQKEAYLKYLGTGITKKMSNVIIDNSKGNNFFYKNNNFILGCFSDLCIDKDILFFKKNQKGFVLDVDKKIKRTC